jgi:superfamily II DNA/RNA helicase
MSDPLDEFFAGLDAPPVPNQRLPSPSSSDSDATERAKAFARPEDASDSHSDPLTTNEPDYVMAPDHASTAYPAWVRDVTFPELRDFHSASDADWDDDVSVYNSNLRPLLSFAPIALKKPGIAAFLEARGISAPTPVQAHALPIAFSGQDVVVTSPTGTGKTLVFLIPLYFHIVAQVRPSPGPLALVLSPTELLVHQTAAVFQHLSKSERITSVELTNAGLKFKQQSALAKGADVVFATPGRLIAFLSAIDWCFCTFVAVDWADRIMESGFFRQLRSILDYIRPDRHMMLLGATLPDGLAPAGAARVAIGRVGAAAGGVAHNFAIVDGARVKREWLASHIGAMDGQILLFVRDRAFCQGLAEILEGVVAGGVGRVHGQMGQREREEEFARFRVGRTRCLVATDIAARGIDIPEIGTVVNVDVPDKPQNYVHRVGRTGRAGREGVSWTLVTDRNRETVNGIVRHFCLTGIEPPENIVQFLEGVGGGKDAKKVFDFDF